MVKYPRQTAIFKKTKKVSGGNNKKNIKINAFFC
jgi:hypothetical protein